MGPYLQSRTEELKLAERQRQLDLEQREHDRLRERLAIVRDAEIVRQLLKPPLRDQREMHAEVRKGERFQRQERERQMECHKDVRSCRKAQKYAADFFGDTGAAEGGGLRKNSPGCASK